MTSSDLLAAAAELPLIDQELLLRDLREQINQAYREQRVKRMSACTHPRATTSEHSRWIDLWYCPDCNLQRKVEK
jgi:hypothetical protein